MADLMTLRKFEALSPFEIKDELINLAKTTSQDDPVAPSSMPAAATRTGSRPRRARASSCSASSPITESKRVMDHPAGIGGMPQASGIADRSGGLARPSIATCRAPSFLPKWSRSPSKKFDFDPDAFVHELVDSIIGDNYPVPDRMLVHNERIVHEYLMWAMCGEPRPAGKFDLYAVEGGTAAMCYIFKSLKANRLLNPGDTIALGTPIFTPYLEMTHLEDYDLKVVHVGAPQENRFQYTDEELKKLEDPKIKAFFVVNPGNPTGMAMEQGDDRQDRQSGEDQASGPDAADRRRLRNLRRRLPLAARRAAAQHDRRLLLFEVFRLHRLAARRDRDPRGQHLRQR